MPVTRAWGGASVPRLRLPALTCSRMLSCWVLMASSEALFPKCSPAQTRCAATKSVFVHPLEAIMKGAFIFGSDITADNAPMPCLRPPCALPGPGCGPRSLTLACALLAFGIAWPAAWAGDKGDHERARAAVQAGEVLPLAAVLDKLKPTYPGQVLELELGREDGRWIYEIKLLQANGQLLKLELDGRTAQVLELKHKAMRQPGPQSAARP